MVSIYPMLELLIHAIRQSPSAKSMDNFSHHTLSARYQQAYLGSIYFKKMCTPLSSALQLLVDFNSKVHVRIRDPGGIRSDDHKQSKQPFSAGPLPCHYHLKTTVYNNWSRTISSVTYRIISYFLTTTSQEKPGISNSIPCRYPYRFYRAPYPQNSGTLSKHSLHALSIAHVASLQSSWPKSERSLICASSPIEQAWRRKTRSSVLIVLVRSFKSFDD